MESKSTSASKKPTGAARRARAQLVDAAQTHEELEAPLGLKMAGLVSGWGRPQMGESNIGDTGAATAGTRRAATAGESEGLTLEELSGLLSRREALGQSRGWHEGFNAALSQGRRQERSAREEVAIATLRHAVDHLAPVLQAFADAEKPRASVARQRARGEARKALTVALADLARVAGELADASF